MLNNVEKQFIIDNYKQLKRKQISHHLGISAEQVSYYINKFKLVKTSNIKITKTSTTICWTCIHACNGCIKPVANWTANYRPLSVNRELVDSWEVHNCPNYQIDKHYC